MTLSLTKGSSLTLTKADGNPVKKFAIGLGWDPVKAKSGIFGWMKGGGENIAVDLDASVIAFDSAQQVVDMVWFRQLHSNDGAIHHSGDDRTGTSSDGGPDEIISVDTSKLNSRVTSLVFMVNSFSGQKFTEVDNAWCNVVDSDTQVESCKYVLTKTQDVTGYVMAALVKTATGWTVKAIGEPTTGRTVMDMERACRNHL